MTKKHLFTIATWTSILLVLLVGVAEATWQAAGAGQATLGTAGSGATDDQFTNSGGAAILTMKVRCSPCPTCVSPNQPQVNYQYVVNFYNALGQFSGSSSSSATQHECRCPSNIISITSGQLFPGPAAAANAKVTVMCSCCTGTTPSWTSQQEEDINNLVPSSIDLISSN